MSAKTSHNAPLIKKAEFGRRRRKLMNIMGSNSIAILPSSSEKLRSRDTDYPFRQHSDFHYLSAFPEPEAVLVLLPGREQGEYIIFCREKDETMETWHGRRYGQEGALKQFACNDAFPIDDIDDILSTFAQNPQTAAPINAGIGIRTKNTPRPVATPLPPSSPR